MATNLSVLVGLGIGKTLKKEEQEEEENLESIADIVKLGAIVDRVLVSHQNLEDTKACPSASFEDGKGQRSTDIVLLGLRIMNARVLMASEEPNVYVRVGVSVGTHGKTNNRNRLIISVVVIKASPLGHPYLNQHIGVLRVLFQVPHRNHQSLFHGGRRPRIGPRPDPPSLPRHKTLL